MSIGRLCRQEYTDFLFLARTPWCWLFDLSAVYDSGTYANLCALAYQGVPGGPVIALFLHIDKTVEERDPAGLSHGGPERGAFSELSPPQRERHIRLTVRRYTRNARHCSIREVIEYLKTGEVK